MVQTWEVDDTTIAILSFKVDSSVAIRVAVGGIGVVYPIILARYDICIERRCRAFVGFNFDCFIISGDVRPSEFYFEGCNDVVVEISPCVVRIVVILVVSLFFCLS
jgi:hypothetical protein